MKNHQPLKIQFLHQESLTLHQTKVTIFYWMVQVVSLYRMCELERKQSLTVLAMSFQSSQITGNLLSESHTKIFYVKGSTAWSYDFR